MICLATATTGIATTLGTSRVSNIVGATFTFAGAGLPVAISSIVS